MSRSTRNGSPVLQVGEHHFLRFELPAIEDDFALRFDQLAEVIPRYRRYLRSAFKLAHLQISWWPVERNGLLG